MKFCNLLATSTIILSHCISIFLAKVEENLQSFSKFLYLILVGINYKEILISSRNMCLTFSFKKYISYLLLSLLNLSSQKSQATCLRLPICLRQLISAKISLVICCKLPILGNLSQVIHISKYILYNVFQATNVRQPVSVYQSQATNLRHLFEYLLEFFCAQ